MQNTKSIALILHPFAEKHAAGLGRATAALCKALLEKDREHSYSLYVKGSPKVSFSGNYDVRTLGKGSIALTGSRYLSRDHAAYVFFTPVIPLFFRPKHSVVIAHDFAYIGQPVEGVRKRIERKFLYLIHARSLKIATRIVAVSEATKQEVVTVFGTDPERITVIHNGYTPPARETAPVQVPEEYFFFVGVLKPRKNIENLIRAYGMYVREGGTASLVIAGKAKGAYADSLRSLAVAAGVANRVQFAGYVSDEQLSYLYRNALALTFVSLQEGFGMPVLEAMSVGTPVITSSEGALAEVAGSAAHLVNPHDPEAIAKGMLHVGSSQEYRARLRASGPAHAATFTWGKAASALGEMVEKVIQH